jgi:membrane associated rhomboid family serine protease
VLPLRDINPTRRLPYVTYVLIALNLAVFAYQFLSLSPLDNQLLVRRHGVIPMFLFSGYGPSLSTLLTSMFLHGGLLHLLSNMWFLHIFGDNVEDAMGHARYALFYLSTGVVAALVHALTDPGSQLPMIGASGAISGVLGGYLLMFPRARVVTLFVVFLIELPAILFILAWFGLQLFSGFGELGSNRGAGVAFFAHVGGFLAGVGWLIIFGKPKLEPRTYLGARIPTRNLRRGT